MGMGFGIPAAAPAGEPQIKGIDGRVTFTPLSYQPPDEEKWLIARVRDRVNPSNRLSARWQFESTWYENILFYLGTQWIEHFTTARQIKPVAAPKWFPKPVDQQLKPRAIRMMANLLKRKPVAHVRPNSADAADREAARDAEHLLSYIDDTVGESALRQKLATIVVLCGTVLSKEWYNPNAGDDVVVPPPMTMRTTPVMQDVAQCPQCQATDTPDNVGTICHNCAYDQEAPAPMVAARQQQTLANGAPIYDVVQEPQTGADGLPMQPTTTKTGEVCSEVVLPFEFHLDEAADSLESAEWCAQQSWRDMEWIFRNFPERAPYVQEQTNVEQQSFYRTALLNVIGQTRGMAGTRPGITAGATMLTRGAMVTEYEERPTKLFPKGLLIIVANNVLLYTGPLRVKGEFAFSAFQFDLVPGRFWGETPCTDMVPVQRRINGIWSQLIINQKTLLNPTIIASNESGLKAGSTYYRPGMVLNYNALGSGTAPQVVPGTPLPPQVLEMLKLSFDTLDRLAGTDDQSIGDAPSGAKSGIALAQLAEANETAHQPRMQRWEDFIAARARKRLKLASDCFSEPRKVKILGPGSTWSVRQLAGRDLRGNTDVTVEAGSSLPRSRQEQIQLIFDLVKEQILVPQADPALLRRILEEVGLTLLDSGLSPDERMALAENAMMEQGILPPLGEFEDTEAHLRMHMPEVKGPAFSEKPTRVQQTYLAHVRMSRQRALQMAAMQIPPPAAPPGAGAAAPSPTAPPGLPAAA